MTLTLRGWNLTVLVAIFGVMSGIAIGNLSLAESTPTSDARSASAGYNAQISRQLGTLSRQLGAINTRASSTNFLLRETLTEFQAQRDDYIAPLLSVSEDIAGFMEAVDEQTFETQLSTISIESAVKSIDSETNNLIPIKTDLNEIDRSTFGTCLYVSDDGGSYCD